MAKHTVTIELPASYEIDDSVSIYAGDVISHPDGHMTILTAVPVKMAETKIMEVSGPIGWSCLEWAARNADKQWRQFLVRPSYLDSRGVWSAPDGFSVPASITGWKPPDLDLELDPRECLVKLTHECLWVQVSVRPDLYTVDCCLDKHESLPDTSLAPRCPGCGRKIRVA